MLLPLLLLLLLPLLQLGCGCACRACYACCAYSACRACSGCCLERYMCDTHSAQSLAKLVWFGGYL